MDRNVKASPVLLSECPCCETCGRSHLDAHSDEIFYKSGTVQCFGCLKSGADEPSEWWCIVDFHDDDPQTEFASLQTGWKDTDGTMHTHKEQWTIDGPGSRELWEKYNEIQHGKCPFEEK